MTRYNYKKLLSEKDFLKVKVRADALMRDGTNLVAIYYDSRRVVFKTRSGTDRRIVWTQVVEITDAGVDTILSQKTFKNVNDLILNSGLKVHCDCLAEGTRILTRSGFKNIEDVVPGDEVLSSDNRWHVVARLLKSELKSNWKKVVARGIREPLIVSDDHKILFSTYRDFCACGCGHKLRDLKDSYRLSNAFSLFSKRMFSPKHSVKGVGDGFNRYSLHTIKDYKFGELLCSPIVRGSVEFDVDYARMLGYYLAEGCIPKKGTTVKITLNTNERDTIARDIEETFRIRGVRVKVSFKEYEGRHWLDVEVFSKQFRKDCEHFCGKGSRTKTVNTDVLFWNDSAKESFLIGHLLGDGAVDDSFRWLSTSKDLIDMLQVLLNSLGVRASTYYANKNEGDLSRVPVYAVSVPVNAFYDTYSKYKRLFRSKDLVNKNLSRGQNDIDEYALYNITSIEDAEPRYGYDICLFDEPHNFVANGVLVSNCPAFLFWGFKYLAWKKGYGLVKENRPPIVRNPFRKGYVCKHLYVVMEVYPFWARTLASKFRKFAVSKSQPEPPEDEGLVRDVDMTLDEGIY